jgi:hypothetical protein
MYWSVWIDFNHNGIFEAAEQLVNNFYTYNSSTSISIPSSALAGQTRMRVRADLNNGVYDPCNPLYYGETEDYTVTIVNPVACAGTPAPGNTLSTSGQVCSGLPSLCRFKTASML